MNLIVTGAILIGLQVLSTLGNLQSGSYHYFSDVTNFYVLMYDLVFFLADYLLGIIGVILLVKGLEKRNDYSQIKGTGSYSITQNLSQTEKEHIIDIVPIGVRKSCEEFQGEKEGLYEFLCEVVKVGTITKVQAAILYERYSIALVTNTEPPKEEALPVVPIVSKQPQKAETTVIESQEPKMKKKSSQKPKKRGGIIASYIILSLLIVGLTVSFLFSLKYSQDKIAELEEQNKDLLIDLDNAERMRNHYKSETSDLKTQLEEKQNTINSLQRAVTQYKAEADEWKQKLLDYDAEDVTYSDSFNSVSDLMKAIKENPKEYNKKKIKVVGTAFKEYGDNDATVLFDMNSNIDLSDYDTSIRVRLQLYDMEEDGQLITINIADDVMHTVLERGDYIKLYGTIRISNGEIYLDKCEYELITAYKGT